jgi:hypothetical protein
MIKNIDLIFQKKNYFFDYNIRMEKMRKYIFNKRLIKFLLKLK